MGIINKPLLLQLFGVYIIYINDCLFQVRIFYENMLVSWGPR